MHSIKHEGSGSHPSIFFEVNFSINVNNEEKMIRVRSVEVIKLIKQLNTLFARMVDDFNEFARANDLAFDPYTRRIVRVDLRSYNNIYESNILKNIGSIMHDF